MTVTVTVTVPVTVTVTNANDPPTVTAATFLVAENSATGTRIGTVSANDVDVGDILTFSITAGNSQDIFQIDPSSGELQVKQALLNFEEKGQHVLTVTATDDGVPARSGTATSILLNGVSTPITAAITAVIGDLAAAGGGDNLLPFGATAAAAPAAAPRR